MNTTKLLPATSKTDFSKMAVRLFIALVHFGDGEQKFWIDLTLEGLVDALMDHEYDHPEFDFEEVSCWIVCPDGKFLSYSPTMAHYWRAEGHIGMEEFIRETEADLISKIEMMGHEPTPAIIDLFIDKNS